MQGSGKETKFCQQRRSMIHVMKQSADSFGPRTATQQAWLDRVEEIKTKKKAPQRSNAILKSIWYTSQGQHDEERRKAAEKEALRCGKLWKRNAKKMRRAREKAEKQAALDAKRAEKAEKKAAEEAVKAAKAARKAAAAARKAAAQDKHGARQARRSAVAPAATVSIAETEPVPQAAASNTAMQADAGCATPPRRGKRQRKPTEKAAAATQAMAHSPEADVPAEAASPSVQMETSTASLTSEPSMAFTPVPKQTRRTDKTGAPAQLTPSRHQPRRRGRRALADVTNK